VTSSVFISYSREDSAYVGRLATYLESVGISVWYDHALLAGQQWSDQIRTEIGSCTAFVVVMSPASVASSWVEREILHAENLGKTVVPLLLRGKVFFSLNNLHYADVTDGRMPGENIVSRLHGPLYTAKGATSASPSIAANGQTRPRRNPIESTTIAPHGELSPPPHEGAWRRIGRALLWALGALAMFFEIVVVAVTVTDSWDGHSAGTAIVANLLSGFAVLAFARAAYLIYRRR
jgi:hypothetical protein